MQYLELLLIIASLVCIGLNAAIQDKINKFFPLGSMVLILILHLSIEGTRWQMIPAYVLWLFACISALMPSKQKSKMILRLLKITGLIVLTSLSFALPYALPVFDLPATTGPYTVGTLDIQLDLDRDEIITADKNDKRSLMIKAWYPSNAEGGMMDPYSDPAGRNGFALKYGLHPDMFNYLDKIETKVYRDIEIANERFPVLIFSHGYNSRANGYYALLTELVSHGYIVFAINHTYESTGSTFTDGTMKYFDYDYANQIQYDTWSIMEPVIESFKDERSFEERHPIVQKGLTTYFVSHMVERWADDMMDVVSALEVWNHSGFFKGKLDVSNIGVFGHSRGGGPAGESLLLDKRIKVGANIDGVQWGQMVDTILHKPFLFLAADWPAEHENLNQHAYVNKSTSYFYEGILLNSGHSSFMDIPFMIPIKRLSQAGDIDPGMAMEIIRSVVIAFFDRHLKDETIDFNALNSEYELLELNVFRGDSIVSQLN